MLDIDGVRSVALEITDLRDRLLAAEANRADEIAAVHPAHRRSAVNLIHYVELRDHDIRELQKRLGLLGLSSLGRAEPYVLATVEAVSIALARLAGLPAPDRTATIALDEGQDMLTRNADALLGVAPAQRSTRIMVTMPGEASTDDALVRDLIDGGMDVARVNCAHDDAASWEQMITFVHAAAAPAGRTCRIAMDLAGPKLRTGPLRPGPRVVRVKPKRDKLGRVVMPARAWLARSAGYEPTSDSNGSAVTIPVTGDAWLLRRRVGDVISMHDARGSVRNWPVIGVGDKGCLATVDKTTYLTTGLTLSGSTDGSEDGAVVGELPQIEQPHRVQHGDRVILTRSVEPALQTPPGSDHHIGCSLSEAFDHARAGHRVFLDDGKLGGIVESVNAEEIAVKVTQVRPGGANLKGGKGINMPDTDLHLGALTEKDVRDLAFVARNADMVNVSFVRRPEDIERLQDELHRLAAGDVGIVLKIENVAAFENLPTLLLTAMRSRLVGVMIARGDLAVEVGFDRLAEVQEEIMWACEAAHVPVIWATQVLDTLARTGQASRAEVTDAAMSERAECVMLNKGPYITDAIRALDSILTRMQHHQDKKRSLLRRLLAWDQTSTHDEASNQSDTNVTSAPTG